MPRVFALALVATLLSFVLPAFASGTEEDVDALRQRLERMQAEVERLRAEREAFRIGAFATEGRFSDCVITMDMTHNVPGFEVVNNLQGTAEVTNGGRRTLGRFFFQEVEFGRTRQTRVTVDGRCENPTVRIVRIDFCEVDRDLYNDCGAVIRTTHPVSIAPRAAR